VLETLGVEDYGIYNVVAGVVTMFGFLNGSMAGASQRYFAFEIGRRDYKQLKETFSLSLEIYVLIAVLVILLAETVGLWFVSYKLVIPPERKVAMLWVYHFSITTFLFTILNTPYMAAIIAHEDMNIYAYVSIVETILKLVVALILNFIAWDKLRLYGILLCVVTFINTTIYKTICIVKYQECKFKFYWNKELFKELTSYTGWSLFGSISGLFKNQAINILLNQFFNPAVVAARGIASSVNNAVSSFSQNFTTALRPQIIKSYASVQIEEMLSLVFSGTKGTYFLMYLFTLPLIIEMPLVLALWLKNIPEYAVIFTRLVLIDMLFESMVYPGTAAIQATGKIKLFQIILGGIRILNLPISWIALLLNLPVYSIMIISIFLTIIAFMVRMIIIRRVIGFPVIIFLREVIVPIFSISILSASLSFLLYRIIEESFLRLCLITFVNICVVLFFLYTIGLNNKERSVAKNIIKRRIYGK
jgi:O-antigen/teichoic acid export membrane protein